jgi:hypothetical protein
MPTVPKYEQPKVGVAPLPGFRRQYAATNYAAAGGALGEAMAGFGTTLARIGAQHATQLFEAEQQRNDQVALLAANRQLGELEAQLLTSPDKGILHKRGPDVLGAREQALALFDEQAGMIASNLNDRQRMRFEGQRGNRRLAVAEAIDRHSTQELDAYERKEVDAALTNAVNIGIANYDNVGRVGEQLEVITNTLNDHGRRLGIGPQARIKLESELRSQVMEGVITRAIVNGKEDGAEQFYTELKEAEKEHGRPLIGAEARERIEVKLKAAGTERAAFTASEEIWTSLEPAAGDDDAAIAIDEMEKAARKRFADKPDVLKATIGYLRERKQGVDAGRKERLDQRDDAVWTAVMQGAGMTQVSRMEAFTNMPGRVQNQVRDYFRQQADRAESQAYTRESRGYYRAQRVLAENELGERRLEQQGWAKYYELSDPAVLSKMTRADILRELPNIGRDHVNRLLTDIEQSKTSTAVTLDRVLLRDVAVDAGMTFANKTPANMSDSEKASLAQFEVAWKTEIGRRGGNKLTYEEKQAIGEQLAVQRVKVDDGMFVDSEVVAASVTGEAAARVYVPLAKIPPDILTQSVNWMRGILPPADSGKTDGQLRIKYRDRLERAYALRVIGRSRAEIEKALKGEP